MRMNRHGHRPGLGYFVLGSVFLHALVVSPWHDAPSAGPMPQSAFQVTLIARHGDASSTPDSGSRPDRNNSTHPTSTTTTALAAVTRRVTVDDIEQRKSLPKTTHTPVLRLVAGTTGNRSRGRVIGTPAKQNPARAGSLEPATPNNGENGHRMQMSARSGSTRHGQHELTSSVKHSRVLAALQQALFPHFNYPPLARRRGWQGSVNVGLRVEADGNLSRIHLVKSSGHALLDRSAVRNITRLRSIPEAAQWLGDSDMDVVLPVLYQLVD